MEFKEQKGVIQSILHDLNQDCTSVQRIANIVSAHNEKQRLIEEQDALKEKKALKQLKLRQKEEEDKAKSYKGKEKVLDSPFPSLIWPQFPVLLLECTYSPPIDTEEGTLPKKLQEDEAHQEEIATLIALVEHYRKVANESNLLSKEYKEKYFETNAKVTTQQELILKLNNQGMEQFQGNEVETLKEGMRQKREENR